MAPLVIAGQLVIGCVGEYCLRMRLHTALLAPALVLALGCGKKADDSKSKTEPKTTETSEAPPEAAKKPLDVAWLGKTVQPPGELAKVKPGMTKEDAAKAWPEIEKAQMLETGFEGVSYATQDGLEGLVTMIRLPADKLAVVEQAWGPGQKADRGGKPVTVWFNPEQGIRGVFSDDGNNKAMLRFEPYTPLAKVLGDGPQVALLDKPFEGKTEDEVKALYPNLVGKTGNLSIPSTEWEFGSGTPLSAYAKAGKVQSLSFSIPFSTLEGQAEIHRLIEAKWGKIKSEVKFGSVGGEKTFVYNKKDPHVEITEPGGYNKLAWSFRIGGK
jgi:hypothetical protein